MVENILNLTALPETQTAFDRDQQPVVILSVVSNNNVSFRYMMPHNYIRHIDIAL